MLSLSMQAELTLSRSRRLSCSKRMTSPAMRTPLRTTTTMMTVMVRSRRAQASRQRGDIPGIYEVSGLLWHHARHSGVFGKARLSHFTFGLTACNGAAVKAARRYSRRFDASILFQFLSKRADLIYIEVLSQLTCSAITDWPGNFSL